MAAWWFPLSNRVSNSATMAPLVNGSLDTTANLSLSGASVATQTTGMPLRVAWRINGATLEGALGARMMPSKDCSSTAWSDSTSPWPMRG